MVVRRPGARVVYADRGLATAADARESVSVAASEAIQSQPPAEAITTLAILLGDPAEPCRPARHRALSSLGDLARALDARGFTAGATTELAASLITPKSRSTRVPGSAS